MSTPPNDEKAEAAVLGLMLTNPRQVRDALELGDGDFYQPVNELVFSVMAELFAAGTPIDSVTVHDALMRVPDSTRRKYLAVGAGLYLQQLAEAAPLAGDVRGLVAILRDHTTRRALLTTAASLAQRAQQPGDQTGDAIAEWATDNLRRIQDRNQADESPNPTDVHDLMAEDFPHNWLVPGIIEKSEKLLFTGFEGNGKTTFLRQFDGAGAAGLHP